ncbi:MAG: carboxypeptidase-like regulatory domain-containing protein [Vicingaceae bacterium]
MLRALISLLLFIISLNAFTQIEGVLIDSITLKPIPYVNIWIEGSPIGTTSDLNGRFNFGGELDHKALVFSAIGYGTKKKQANSISKNIYLVPKAIGIKEVSVYPEEEKELTVDKFRRHIIFTYSTGTSGSSKMIAKYFPYKEGYSETNFLKSLGIHTLSDVKNAILNVRLLTTDSLGKPSNELYDKNILVNIKKGNHKTHVDLSKLYLTFPKNGFFVVLEWLIIPENRFEYKAINSESGKKMTYTSYEPSVCFVPADSSIQYWRYSGEWREFHQSHADYSFGRFKGKSEVPAIELVLTN